MNPLVIKELVEAIAKKIEIPSFPEPSFKIELTKGGAETYFPDFGEHVPCFSENSSNLSKDKEICKPENSNNHENDKIVSGEAAKQEQPEMPDVASSWDNGEHRIDSETGHPQQEMIAVEDEAILNNAAPPDNADIRADDYNETGNEDTDGKGVEKSDAQESEIQELKDKYIDNIVDNSEVPATIDKEKASAAEFEKQTPDETAEKREEFNRVKNDLIKQWEEQNGQPWPTYKEDVYSEKGNLIRKAGDKYDAHHIQPLGMGGKNEVSNITPLHAECHYDKQGVHSPASPYAKLEQKLGE